MTEFQKFPKIPRLNREIIVTEKIDGTNAQILIEQLGESSFMVTAGSRNRWLDPREDNHGFAAWVEDQADQLIDVLGPGRHFGEWWGHGIQRGYGLSEKRFSVFNVKKWHEAYDGPLSVLEDRTKVTGLRVVPVLGEWPNIDKRYIDSQLANLQNIGSFAAPGFNRPEGVIVYHTAANHLYKATIEGDDVPKGK